MSSPTICLIGDILVDVTLTSKDPKLRLGGIIHAARCMWALEIPYSVGYFAPAYLDDQIHSYLKSIGCIEIFKVGNVTGTPYVFLIQEPKEVGNQGYEFFLRDEIKIELDSSQLEKLKTKGYKDHIVIAGNYDIGHVINVVPGQIHIDVANNINDIEVIRKIGKKVHSLFISTSSTIFKKYFAGDFEKFCDLFDPFAHQVILKENRGGSRHLAFTKKVVTKGYSQTQPILHSVGVGDVFNCVFVANHKKSIDHALALSSWIAAEYAMTTYPDDFKQATVRLVKSNIEELTKMKGVSLPWENRKSISIYIAAPDFDFVDASPIDQLADALIYHNFNPRRPIKENGQMEEGAQKSRRQELFRKDMILLDECSLLIAVLLYDDPGTFTELGLAAAKGIPTLLYDPYNLAKNCIITELPNVVSRDLDEIISEVFSISSKIYSK